MLLWIIGLVVFLYFYDYFNVQKIKRMPIWTGKHLRNHLLKQEHRKSMKK